ncbi:Ig-like domain-containing protein, partial [Aquimarina sp. AU474]|uniref:Ig-like domain-containing protein n=1 Tax=Aquimarina sp. AU474 TaxID=2108529 RepID=UPI000D699508
DTPADVAEDSGTTNIAVLGNDSFGGDGPSTGTINVTAIPATVGTAVVNNGGTPNDPTDDTIDFTPALDYNGPVTITYEIEDADGDTDTATVTFDVTSVDDSPTANDDSLTVDEDSTAGVANQIDVSTNDNIGGDGGDGDDFALATGPSNGTVTEVSDGVFQYVPDVGFSGTDSFTYTITDVDGSTVTATVNITVNDTGNPIAVDDTASTTEDTPVTTGNVLTNDTVIDNATITAFDATSTNGGTVLNNGDGTFTYTPPVGFVGDDTFTYTLCDDDIPPTCSTATVTVTVGDAGDPVAVDDTVTTTEDTPVTTGNVLDNDTVIDNATITAFDTTSTNGGTVVNNGDGTFTYTPPVGFVGDDTFTYTLCDDDTPPSCSTATVTITVGDEGNPVAVDDTVTTTEDTPVTTGNVLDNDTVVDNATITAFDVTSTNGGTVVNNGDGTFTYTPPTGFVGDDTFTYTLCDDDTPPSCDTATVTVTVGEVANPLLSLIKTSEIDGTQVDDVITYTFTVANIGNVVIDNITIDDPLTGSVSLAITPSTLAPNESGTATATYAITQADINFGEVMNSATVIGQDPTGNDVVDVSDSGDETVDEDNDGNPTNDPTITMIEQLPNLDLRKTGIYVDANNDGVANAGDEIRYEFIVENTGNVDITNIVLADPLPGIVIEGGPIDLAAGEVDNDSFSATYILTEENLLSGSVTNQATVTGQDPNGIDVTDVSDDPLNDTDVDLDNDGDFEDETVTVIVSDGEIVVYTGLSPNGDGVNDEFRIVGLSNFPKNTLRIFNRWGVLVFDQDGYEQPGARFFVGISEGRTTVSKNDKLPVGTYYYVLEYENASGILKQKAGFLYINN